MRKDLHFPSDVPLFDEDTETQTYGCRQKNPHTCKSHMMAGICAFMTDDNVCKKPSRTWAKQYALLKALKDGT